MNNQINQFLFLFLIISLTSCGTIKPPPAKPGFNNFQLAETKRSLLVYSASDGKGNLALEVHDRKGTKVMSALVKKSKQVSDVEGATFTINEKPPLFEPFTPGPSGPGKGIIISITNCQGEWLGSFEIPSGQNEWHAFKVCRNKIQHNQLWP